MPATLNSTLTGSSRLRACHTLCTSVAVQPMSNVSGRLNSSTPSRMNRKFTDIVPSIPGNCTFSPDASTATAREHRNRNRSCDWKCTKANPSTTTPKDAVMPTNTFVCIENRSVSAFIKTLTAPFPYPGTSGPYRSCHPLAKTQQSVAPAHLLRQPTEARARPVMGTRPAHFEPCPNVLQGLGLQKLTLVTIRRSCRRAGDLL